MPASGRADGFTASKPAPYWDNTYAADATVPAVLTPADRASYRSYADTERYQPSEQLHATYNGQPSSHHKP
jgi:hypothetical protein